MSNDRQITEQNTDLVTLILKVNGEKVSREYQVASAVVRKEINRIPTANVVILDGDAASEDFPAGNSELFIPGNEMEILVGYHNDESTLFKGAITKQSVRIRKEGSPALTIECKDIAFKMTINPVNKYFYELSDSDILEEVLGNYNSETDIASTDVTHDEVIQYNLTDWDFMITRSELNGMVCIPDDGTLTIQPPDFDQDPVVNLQFGATLLEFDGELNGRNQVGTVISRTWNYADQEVLETEASEPSITEPGNITGSDMAGSLGLEAYTLQHGGTVSEEVLQLWADALLLKKRMAKIHGRAKCKGKTDLKPGTLITLNGVGDRFNGTSFVSGVVHTIRQGKWEADIQIGMDDNWFTEKMDLQKTRSAVLAPSGESLHIGVVTELEGDPDGEDRVRVKLPIVNADEDGVWTRLATLDAGEERGSFFRPEVGDEVVVGLINKDLKTAVILGMLHSSAKPAPEAISDDNHKKGFVSREGTKLLFDDEKPGFIIEMASGKTIVLDDDEGTIKLEDENGNVIAMNADGITLESAKDLILKASGDIQMEGQNITGEAQMSWKAEGSSGAELTSSATLTLKGSLTQIN